MIEGDYLKPGSDSGYKYLPAGRLVELLRQLPVDARLIPNDVRNLAVYDASGTTFLGYIDFLLEGEFETP